MELSLVFFLPFPRTVPSVSEKGSWSSNREPYEVLACFRKAGDDHSSAACIIAVVGTAVPFEMGRGSEGSGVGILAKSGAVSGSGAG